MPRHIVAQVMLDVETWLAIRSHDPWPPKYGQHAAAATRLFRALTHALAMAGAE